MQVDIEELFQWLQGCAHDAVEDSEHYRKRGKVNEMKAVDRELAAYLNVIDKLGKMGYKCRTEIKPRTTQPS